MSESQLSTLKRIFERELATSKQLDYLDKLGYKGSTVYSDTNLTKRQASEEIQKLLNKKNE